MDRSFGFGGTNSLPIVSRPTPEVFRTVRITPNETPDALCTTVHTEPDQALQVIPDERGSYAGKEPERVPVEPETPDVAVPAKQPHNTTVPVDTSDMSRQRRLAVAMILQAIEDSATEWFFSSYSRQSVDFWCSVAALGPGQVGKKAQQNGKVMAAKT